MSNLTKINFTQKQILGEFMSEHSELAKGIITCSAQGRATANRLWENLTTKLNASGPPTKDSKSWRKVYADQKQRVKKKLTFNKLSRLRTGGGPSDEKHLSQTDELILEAAGIEDEVDGLKNVSSFGCGSPEKAEATSVEKRTLEEDLSHLVSSDFDQPVSKKSKLVKPKESKICLLKKNMDLNEDYHSQMLQKIDMLVEMKKKSLEMKQKEFNISMEIKKIELEIKKKEYELLN